MDIRSDILSEVLARRNDPEDEILLTLWNSVNEVGLRANPLGRAEQIRRARAWVESKLIENRAALCALPLVTRYCAGEEMTEAVIAAIAEFFAAKVGLQNGVAIGLVASRQGLKRFCSGSQD